MRETSLLAFEELKEEGKLGDRQVLILHALMMQKDHGLTDWEITSLLQQHDPNMVRPRRRELVRLRLVVDAGVRECSVTKKRVHFWKVAEQMPEKLEIPKSHPCAFCNGTGVMG